MITLAVIDLGIVEYLAAHRTPFATALAYSATAIGSTLTVSLLAILFALYLAHTHRHLLIPFVISIVGSVASFEIIKDVVARVRPPELYAVYLPPEFSFPSGHATTAVTLFGFVAYVFARRQKRPLRLGIYALAGVVALCISVSRVYLGVHYPSDIIAGLVLGAFWLWVGLRCIPLQHG